MKKYLLLVLTLFCLVFSGCARITDDNNLNIIAAADADRAPPDFINFYCQTTTNMQRFLDHDEYRTGTESAYNAAIDAWAGVKNLVFVKNRVWEKDNAFFTAKYLDADNYSASAGSDLKTALENQAEEKGSGLKIIITDLNSQLADYDTIACALIDSALAKGLAVAIIGIDTPLDPYYIIAVGENRLVSDYIAAFKERPEIQDLTNAPESEFALDIVQPINYQILADKGGILGIDYEGIKFIEGYGSFSQVIEIDRAGLDRKEGMFNFQPSESLAAANTIKDGAKIPVRNLGAKSLLTAKEISLRTTETQQHYAGKIKFDMPFNIIEGVYLCAMDCQVETELFLPEGKIFQPYSGNFSRIIETAVAQGVYPGQGKWRVYDKPYNERFVIKTGSASKEKYVEHPAHSLTFNITMPNAAFLPAGAKTVKLDIHINFLSSLDTVPKWVKEWDKSKSPDLLNMLSVVYDYQKQSGNSENSFTVYIGVR